jgi:transcriptional regulator with XRE-family HTH domain
MIKQPFQNRLGILLRKERKSRRMTQIDLAKKAGVSAPTLRLLERGRGHIHSWIKVLNALALCLRGKNLPQASSIGKQVVLLRKRRNLGQRTLAELIGVTQPTIVQLERLDSGRLSILDRALFVLGAGPALFPIGATPKFFTHAGNSSSDHGWRTPKALLETLYRVFERFDLDPCSPTFTRGQTPVRARVHYTIVDDGLSLPWHGVVFLNPPYGRTIGQWIEKAKAEVASGNARLALALIPARTDTRWWHEGVAGSATVFFLRGRLSFDDAGQSAPFPSALVIWGGTSEELSRLQAVLPDAWVLPDSGTSRAYVIEEAFQATSPAP